MRGSNGYREHFYFSFFLAFCTIYMLLSVCIKLHSFLSVKISTMNRAPVQGFVVLVFAMN